MTVHDLVGNGLYRMGSSGPVVEAIQLGLKAIGYGLKGTGYFGPATDVAVTAFQKRAGLKADGIVGPQTALAIDQAITTTGTATPLPVAQPTNAEVSRPLWVQAGLELLGTHEGAGGADNKVILDWAKEEGGDIAKEYDHDVIPWCALFANHILTHVGLKGTETLWALDFAGKWPAIRLAAPAVGAFAPMLRNGGGHITVVVGKDQNGNIMGLGGNQSDQVSIAPFALSRLNKGFWWPESVPLPKATGMASLPVVKSNGKLSANEG